MRLRFGDGWAAEGSAGEAGSSAEQLDGKGPLRQAQGAFGHRDLPGPQGKAQEGQVPGPEVLNGLRRPQASFPLPVFCFIWESPEGCQAGRLQIYEVWGNRPGRQAGWRAHETCLQEEREWEDVPQPTDTL